MFSWEAVIQSIVANVRTGLMVIDSDMQVNKVNPYLLQILNVKEEWLLHQNLGQVFDQSKIAEWMDKLMRAEENPDESSFNYEWKLGEQHVYLEFRAKPIEILGKNIGMLLFIDDISQSTKINMELVRAEKLATISHMATGTVHEIRNPLTTIKGFLQLFNSDIHKLDRLNQLANQFSQKWMQVYPILSDEITKMERVMEQFLFVCNKHSTNYQLINVNEAFHNIISGLQNEAVYRGVSLICEYPRTPLTFFGDPKEFNQLILQLIFNSFDAITHDLGEVRIQIRANRDQFYIYVMDNGIGIEERMMDAVLEPFFTTKDESIGMGLPICQQIVSRMGGDMTIRSKEGYGTTVRIKLPVLQGVANDVVPSISNGMLQSVAHDEGMKQVAATCELKASRKKQAWE